MTKLYNLKNNVPVYMEQKITQTDLQAKDILKTKTLIPSKFIRLEKTGKNNWGSTKGLPKTLCERYGFSCEGEWIQIDIPQELVKELDLSRGEDIPYPVYLSPEVLKRKPICGGITIEKAEEMFIKHPFSQEKATQTTRDLVLEKLTHDLTAKIKEFEQKYNQLRSDTSTILYPEANIPALAILDEHLIAQAQEVMEKLNNLRTERNQAVNQNGDLQQTITTLQNEITQLNKNLQTTQQERDQLQQSLKSSLIGSLFKNKQKNKRIKELNDSLSFLRGLLVDKNQQVTNLITQQNNLQDQVNGLNQELNTVNALIINAQNLLGINNLNNLPQLPEGETLTTLLARPTPNQLQEKQTKIDDLKRQNDKLQQEKNNMQTQRDDRPNITLAQWNNDYSKRPTQQELNNLQTQLDNIRTELDNTKNERDNYRMWRDNHVCSCNRTHCNDSNCKCFCRICEMRYGPGNRRV